MTIPSKRKPLDCAHPCIFTSALLSAFFNKLRRKMADFFGHRACPLVLFSFFACGIPRKKTGHLALADLAWKAESVSCYLVYDLTQKMQAGKRCACSHGGGAITDLSCAAYASAEATEGDGTLVVDDVLEVPLRLRQLHVLQGARCLSCVLEVSAQVAALGLQPNA